jgi:hypothetical protein
MSVIGLSLWGSLASIICLLHQLLTARRRGVTAVNM